MDSFEVAKVGGLRNGLSPSDDKHNEAYGHDDKMVATIEVEKAHGELSAETEEMYVLIVPIEKSTFQSFD